MTDNKTEITEEQPVTQICFNYNGTEYTMEFNRATAAQTEKLYDFTLQDVADGKMGAFEALFHGAFLLHHPKMKQTTVEMFLDKMPNKQEVFAHLAEMFTDCMYSLFDDPKEGEAISWTAK